MTLADEINQMIVFALTQMQITSAGGDSPKINRLITIGDMKNADLESIIANDDDGLQKDAKKKSKNKKKKDDEPTGFNDDLGEINNLTSSQIGNITTMAKNPAGFVTNTLTGLGKGVAPVAFALIMKELVDTALEEAMKPGRQLDRRFRIIADEQTLIFTNRKVQQELKQGFKHVIVTAMAGLRGEANRNMISGNLYHPGKISGDFIDTRLIDANTQPRAKSPRVVVGRGGTMFIHN